MTPDTAAAIARAIGEHYPNEAEPDQLAEQLRAVASAHGIDDLTILLWVHDLPRHPLSTGHLIAWCTRYGLAKGGQP
jgi:glycyl-tRNA synthetase beta subunit